jgi:hypothetical protein
MQYYIVLTIATAVTVVLGMLLWLKTRNLAFPLGLALIYYMTLFGGWFLVYDKLGGDSGKHYAYLEDKMFPVYLDGYYLESLVIYSVFVIVLAGTTLVLVRRPNSARAIPQRSLHIAHWPIIVISGCAGTASYLIIRDGLQAAKSLGMPAYALMKRGLGEVSPWFTVHQVGLRLAVVPCAIGLAVALSGRDPRLLAGRRSPWALLLYSLILGCMLVFAFLLGYKSEIFVAGLTGGLFYLMNIRQRRVFPALLAGLATLIGMSLVDKVRFISLDQLDAALLIDSISRLGDVFTFATSSNEAFAGHFSMYGVLSLHVPITYGAVSLVSIAASVVPRVLWPDRPADIYAYYAHAVNAIPGQGYTINHATAWYLNFGIAGVIGGAILFAWVWATCFNLCLRAPTIRNRFLQIAARIAPSTFTAYIPFLLSSGPETYKGLLIEAFVLPTVVLTVAAARWRPGPHRRRLIEP